MKELKKQHLEMLQLLESIEVMFQNGDSIHPNSVIRGAIQTAIGMEVNVTNVNDKCDNKQTAVQEFALALMRAKAIKSSSTNDFIKSRADALQMEKEQMEDIYIGHNQYNDEYETFEQYYNETFKSE